MGMCICIYHDRGHISTSEGMASTGIKNKGEEEMFNFPPGTT